MKGEDNYKVILERQNADLVQTLGTFYIVNEADRIQFKCWALELPSLKNIRNKSRIPAGNYELIKRWSKKFGDHLFIKDVENRSFILVHSGNTYLDTRGCILVGDDLGYVNRDSHLDVLHSKDTLEEILKLLPKKTTIMIVENEHEIDELVMEDVQKDKK